MIVTIPDRRDGSYKLVVVEIADTCPVCGAHRGPLSAGSCSEGDRVSQWHNECGHVDLHEDVIVEAEARASAYGYAALVDVAMERGADVFLADNGKIYSRDDNGISQLSAAWLLGWLRWMEAIEDAHDALTDAEHAQLERAEQLAEAMGGTIVPVVDVDGVVRWRTDCFSPTGRSGTYSLAGLESLLLSISAEQRKVA